MNYGKKSVREKQRRLNSKSAKLSKMLILSIFKAFLICIITLGVAGVCAGVGMFNGILSSAPDISNINVNPTGYATYVYDNKGNQLDKLVSEQSNRIYVTLDKVPNYLGKAFVAIEDERFYEHNGIDIKGIIRAGVVAVKNRGLSEGASTITQQLLKNNVFKDWTSENSNADKIERKIQEQYLALELEKKLGVSAKDTILELYINSINLGQNTLGVQAASLRYFNKPAAQLTLSESAVIAAITKNPSKYNPISHPEFNAERRKKVLNNMLDFEYISETDYNIAMADDVYSRIQTVNESVATDTVNTYFVDELTEQIIEDLKEMKGYNETQAYHLLYSGGLQIYTTLDPSIQSICDEVFENEENFPENVKWYLNCDITIQKADGSLENHSTEMLKAYFLGQDKKFNLLYDSKEDAYAGVDAYLQTVMAPGDDVYSENIYIVPQPQVSITIEEQSTGYIVAMVGGRGTKEGSRTLNRSSNTLRQPGSTFKVVSTYAPALDSAGMTLANVQNDAPYNYANGRPVANWYGNNYKGLCSLRYGIEQSLNIVAVKTLTDITPQLGFDYLQNFGFSTLVDRREASDGTIMTDILQPLALGGITDGVSNLELNAAYASIANQGTYNKPTLYTKIVDHDGNVLIDKTTTESHRVIKETTAFLLTDAMVDVVTKGTGGSVNFGKMSIAGKTGTTTDYKDVWFAGFTPYYTATTWAGFDNNVSLSSSAEKNLAMTLWKQVMSRIHEELPDKPFEKPKGIVSATICSRSGKLPLPGICDPTLRTEYFAEGTVPKDYCDVHYQGMVCAATGLPAETTCPYQIPGILELVPNKDGVIIKCPHTIEYLTNPLPIAPPAAP